MGVVVLTEIVVVFLAYMVINVPVLGPKLTREEAGQHWTHAVLGALFVAVVVFVVVRTALRARAALGPPQPQAANTRSGHVDAAPRSSLPRIPRSLRLERVPAPWARAAAAISIASIPVSVSLEAPLWAAWLAILAPWAPIVALEARQKFAADPVFTCFGLIVVLQVLHMVEHSTQVGQLLASGGSFASSRGVIGQLDFETVHFVTDTILWIYLALLAIRFKARNAWLWVAFAAASLHEVEHLYLFWLYVLEHTVYLSGGAAGIMGNHGLIGSPLDRPYLHFSYNFIVIVPMVIAFWDEARHQDRVGATAADPLGAS